LTSFQNKQQQHKKIIVNTEKATISSKDLDKDSLLQQNVSLVLDLSYFSALSYCLGLFSIAVTKCLRLTEEKFI
jgi:hypothetical protein